MRGARPSGKVSESDLDFGVAAPCKRHIVRDAVAAMCGGTGPSTLPNSYLRMRPNNQQDAWTMPPSVMFPEITPGEATMS